MIWLLFRQNRHPLRSVCVEGCVRAAGDMAMAGGRV